MLHQLHRLRFEFLLFALLMMLFNKIFFTDGQFFTQYVWPANMILLGLATFGIFRTQYRWMQMIKNILLVATLLVPFFVSYVFSSPLLSVIAILTYMIYYFIILVEVLRQITAKGEVSLSLVLGSLSGYLLLIVVALFSLLLLEFLQPGSYGGGFQPGNVAMVYHQMSYFSMITIATVGYGDIVPVSDSARLLAAFFSICGQFYMVTLVGIIISKFSSKK